MTMETVEQPTGELPLPNTTSTTTSGEQLVDEIGSKEMTQLSIPPGEEEQNATSHTVAEGFINHGEYNTLIRFSNALAVHIIPVGG
jgi:hypothetical protein